MKKHHPTSEKLIFPPVYLDEERRWPIWSINVELPPDVEAEIVEYEKADEFAVWTVIIHEALYIYRWQFWTKNWTRSFGKPSKQVSVAQKRRARLR